MCFPAASSEPAFSARFFLVVVELTPTGRSLLHMWHLHLAARPVTMGGCFERRTYRSKDVAQINITFPIPVYVPIEETMTEKEPTTASSMNSSQFSFDTFGSPMAPKSKPCTSNLQSACRLSLTTRRLYSQEMSLPEGVEAISVTPSAGGDNEDLHVEMT